MRRSLAALLLALGLLAFTAPLFADEAKKDGREIDIPRSKLPEKVGKAALDALPGGKIEDIDKEIKDGKTIWELGVSADGKDYEVLVDDDGKLISKVEKKEEKIKVADLPAAVVDGVQKEFAGAKITSAVKITKGDAQTFEMNIDIGKKTWEIVTTPEGKLLSKAEVKEEEEKEKK